ncbi:hypothetical protein BJ138DRAFT_1130383 [Hygrophoropsis aurantiaca]|uniref:Uncharacterized protein n=1 Tax=Hygrophoropsis aurantiaca TaxID=72124 RepID=A0ACB7ZY90_9AGAM|nr:hypothetical protein BJ138DRAFT_1130383 [Hygrophoropsis aurantiaca]
MTTWVQPVRHPWFDPISTKRKFREDDYDDRSSHLISPKQKRIRFNTLEHGFAHLTLGSSGTSSPFSPTDIPWSATSNAGPTIDEFLYPSADASSSMVIDSHSEIVLPSSIEEPTSPQQAGVLENAMADEVDLDRAEFDRSEYQTLDNAEGDWVPDMIISPALVSQLKKRSTASHPIARIVAPAIDNSKALVLFKPLPIAQTDEACDPPSLTHSIFSPRTTSENDDAMEVEFF